MVAGKKINSSWMWKTVETLNPYCNFDKIFEMEKIGLLVTKFDVTLPVVFCCPRQNWS